MDGSPPRRRRAPFLIGLVALLLALPLGYVFFFGAPTAPPPVAPPVLPVAELRPVPPPTAPVGEPAAPRLVELRMTELKGQVEVRRGDGEWTAARQGDALRASDSVRTLEGAYAVIIGGESVEIRMEAGTEVAVSDLTDSLSRLLLGNGMTTVRVKSGARHTLEMLAAGGDAKATSEGGRFTMSNNGGGTVALASFEGETTLSGAKKLVIVRAGQQSIVRPGQGPSDPTPIPASLLLKVNWPVRPRRQALVSGQTEPGGRLLIDGKSIQPDAEGRFSHTVALKEGANRLRVEAVSVGGRRAEQQQDVHVDTTPPKDVIVDPGLWK
ncbi:hypothetical protein [Melittangium boletus]|uniref:hypothetical protein n=1 Tax=Melittangium boletus TaxID=83453 RepID=UPI003DA2A849